MSATLKYPLIETAGIVGHSNLEKKTKLREKEETILPRLGACTKQDFKHLNNFLVSELKKLEKQKNYIKLKSQATKHTVKTKAAEVENLTSYRDRVDCAKKRSKEESFKTKQRSYNKSYLYNDTVGSSNYSGKIGLFYNTPTYGQLFNRSTACVSQRGDVPFSKLKADETSQSWRLPKVKPEEKNLIKKSQFGWSKLTSLSSSTNQQCKVPSEENHSVLKRKRFVSLFARMNSARRLLVSRYVGLRENTDDDDTLAKSLLIRLCDLQKKSLGSRSTNKKHLKANEEFGSAAMPFLKPLRNDETSHTAQENGERRLLPDISLRESLAFSSGIKNEACATEQNYDSDLSEADVDNMSNFDDQEEHIALPTKSSPIDVCSKKPSPDICQNKNRSSTRNDNVTHIEFTAFLDTEGIFHPLPGIYTFEQNDYDIWSRPQKK